ncbi:MAG: hypothetical protein JRJ59_09030, partial [Deltaproteobacteria bacterium]|nr:hypothetical protein [Deltaproteobacteria bacterium]
MKGRGLVFTLLGLVLAGVIVLGVVVKFEGQSPTVTFEPARPSVLGLENRFQFVVRDEGQGLRSVRLTITQGDKVQVLAEKKWPSRHLVLGSDAERAEFSVAIPVKKLDLTDGPAKLKLVVRDHAWRESFHGNKHQTELDLTIDTRPPVVSLVSRAHYLNLGGCGLTVYRVNEEAESGVVDGDIHFTGLPLTEAGEGVFHCLFALPWDLPPKTRLSIRARDKAGNVTKVRLPARIKARRLRHAKMNISISFLEAKMPEFRQEYPDLPADDLEAYLQVNREIRRRNDETIRQVTTVVSPQRLWSGAFCQLENSALTAGFADQRTYFFNGKEIDRQVHMGIDLASTAQADVPAANH